VARVGHLWFGFEFGKFPLKMSTFSIIFPSDQKKSLQVGSESTRVDGLLFTAGQKKLGSGQGPSLVWVGQLLKSLKTFSLFESNFDKEMLIIVETMKNLHGNISFTENPISKEFFLS